MRLPLIFLFLTALCASTLGNSQATVDILETSIFQTRKSDTSIKPFVFPKSMIVIRSCYPENNCWFLNPGPGAIVPLDKTVSSKANLITKVLNDEKVIKKYLVRLDPARIALSKRGTDSKVLSLSKHILMEKGKQSDVDFIFVFVRTIKQFGSKLIETQGRIYLVKQDKVLVVPSNNQSLDLGAPDLRNHLEEINRNGLQQLAINARKVIMSHKFEKRRSNY